MNLIETVYSLNDIYSNPEPQVIRYASIRTKFVEKFGIEPDFYVRSPGRVNLIGEHIDYSGFSVLPMALDRDVVIAVAKYESKSTDPIIKLSSTHPVKYEDVEFTHEQDGFVTIDNSILDWSNYFKGPYKIIFQSHKTHTPVSFCAMIDGNVPAGGGVSSSSALSSAATIAILEVLGLKIPRTILTKYAIAGEQMSGVHSGGMDQSISILAQKESALLIHFVPELSVEKVKIPTDGIIIEPFVFVIANTCVVSEKRVTAPIHFNLRVVETRLAAAILAKKLDLPEGEEIFTLRGVADAYLLKLIEKGTINKNLVEKGNEIEALQIMILIVETHLKQSQYSIQDICTDLCKTESEMRERYVGDIKIAINVFELYKRALHVYKEATRVFQFRNVCQGQHPYSGKLLSDLGKLLNESQESCDKLFDCTCPELDQLTRVCREAGAYGSRLTGAGWGGCTVSLIQESNLEKFIQTLKSNYYDKSEAFKNYNTPFGDVVFHCKPSIGALIYKSK